MEKDPVEAIVEPQMVTPTAPRQTQPAEPRDRPISLISPSPMREEPKKSDNTLLFIGVAALAGFFLVK